jgi:cytochrome b6-f complex iron-sulfur subunit
MASASSTRSEAASRASIARTGDSVPSTQVQPGVQVAAPTRREFLYYIWGASIALMLGQVGAGVLWFAFPRFREGEFGADFVLNADALPDMGDAPVFEPAGRFHLSNTDKGLLALYGVCTHLGCLPKWAPTNERFECPCHGSKYRANGTYIEGPAPRGLDRFVTTVIFTDGTSVTTDENGDALALPAGKTIQEIRVNTGKKVMGPPHGVV